MNGPTSRPENLWPRNSAFRDMKPAGAATGFLALLLPHALDATHRPEDCLPPTGSREECDKRGEENRRTPSPTVVER
jgi:hypothetical protein